MAVDIQLCSEDLDMEISLQLMIEILFCMCKSALSPLLRVRKINSYNRKQISQFMKNLNCHLNRLSIMYISPYLRKPMRPISKITIICRDSDGPEMLGVTMFEVDPATLNTLHPRLMLEFLELFVEESAKCLKRKWASVQALSNLPTLSVVQIKQLSQELRSQLCGIGYNQDKEYYPIVSVILSVGSIS